MAQKFTSLEEAADQLGISKDRLTQLREAGKVRGYRDGRAGNFAAKISKSSRPRASRPSTPSRATCRSISMSSRSGTREPNSRAKESAAPAAPEPPSAD